MESGACTMVVYAHCSEKSQNAFFTVVVLVLGLTM